MALLDTTALIDLTRREASRPHQRVARVIRDLRAAGDSMATSRLNEAEFRVGQFRANDRATESDKIERVLATVVILDFDAAAAEQFARVRAALLNKGKPTGEIDTLVAAIALVNGQSLVTRNPTHFADIDELTVVTY